jgi:hypothetical protein
MEQSLLQAIVAYLHVKKKKQIWGVREYDEIARQILLLSRPNADLLRDLLTGLERSSHNRSDTVDWYREQIYTILCLNDADYTSYVFGPYPPEHRVVVDRLEFDQLLTTLEDSLKDGSARVNRTLYSKARKALFRYVGLPFDDNRHTETLQDG